MSGHLGSSVKLLQKPRPQRAERLAASRSTVSLEYSAPAPAMRRAASMVPPNSRHLNRLSRYSSTTGPITVSRQERQIVQSWLDLDDFLPRITSPLKGL